MADIVPKILAFSGSSRVGSLNKKLLSLAVAGARAAGAEVTELDLRDLALPIFDEDIEKKGYPDGVKKLKDLMYRHPGYLIASPEYNSSLSPLLKNALDWASRPDPGMGSLACFVGKVIGLVGTSPGDFGAIRGLVHLRAVLGHMKAVVIPEQVAIPRGHLAFNEDGTLKDANLQKAVAKVGSDTAQWVRKFSV